MNITTPILLASLLVTSVAHADLGDFFDSIFQPKRRQPAPTRPQQRPAPRQTDWDPRGNYQPRYNDGWDELDEYPQARPRVKVTIRNQPRVAEDPWEGKRPTAVLNMNAVTSMAPQIYQAVGVTRLWSDANGISARGLELKDLLMSAAEQGLLPSEYWTGRLETLLRLSTAGNTDDFEAQATASFLMYADHLMNGRINPAAVAPEIKISRKKFDVNAVAAVLKAVTGDLKTNAEQLAPKWVAYRNLKLALARLSKVDQFTEYPPIGALPKKFKTGDQNDLWKNAKIRMQTLGFKVADVEPTLNAELPKAIATYLSEQTIPGSNDVKRAREFWAHVKVELPARIQQIKLTMEKIRWMPNPETHHLYVNLAFQKLRVFENEQVTLQMKTINGKSARKSPMLKDKLTIVELNPTWTVPARLIAEDKAPAIRADRNYLEDHNFIVKDSRTRKEIPSWQVNWSRVANGDADDIVLRQGPGLGNALGIMKFHLTNSYAIYLHDTNERDLFTQNHRLLSSGCIRLQAPHELAHYLLKSDAKWSAPGAIENALATTQWATPEVKTQVRIKLDQALPVYLMYLTAEAEADGSVKFANDYYGQDQALFDLLKSRF